MNLRTTRAKASCRCVEATNDHDGEETGGHREAGRHHCRESGSILLFTAHTQRGKEWIHAHIPSDATFFAGSLVVELRYALDLAVGMTNDGLKAR